MKKFYNRKCLNKSCRKKFIPVRANQNVCSYECSVKHSYDLADKKKKQDKKDWRQRKSEMKEATMAHRDYLKTLQVVFNTWVRSRDKNRECISCGRSMQGRKGDASHFFSVGQYPQLRFDERNVHLACVPCNQFKGGNLHEYAERLPFRIGGNAFFQLNAAKNFSQKLSIEEIKEKIIHYKSKIKELN